MQQTREHPDGAATLFRQAIRDLAADAGADAAGVPRPRRAPLRPAWLMDDPAEIDRQERLAAERERADAAREWARRDAEFETYFETLGEQAAVAAAMAVTPPDADRCDGAGSPDAAAVAAVRDTADERARRTAAAYSADVARSTGNSAPSPSAPAHVANGPRLTLGGDPFTAAAASPPADPCICPRDPHS